METLCASSLETHKAAGAMSLGIKKKKVSFQNVQHSLLSNSHTECPEEHVGHTLAPVCVVGPLWGGGGSSHFGSFHFVTLDKQALPSHPTSVYPSVKWGSGKDTLANSPPLGFWYVETSAAAG